MSSMASERWTVWCEHADGRQYRMGDSTQTHWSKGTAERIAAHMSAHENGRFVAQAFAEPAPMQRNKVDKEAVALVRFLRFLRNTMKLKRHPTDPDLLLWIEEYRSRSRA